MVDEKGDSQSLLSQPLEQAMAMLTDYSLQVPLDYTLPNGTRAYVPLIKYPATAKPYKGMVLTNPGGPGESGIEFLANNSISLAPIVGPNYDFVAWEPRGLGYSVPATNCTGALSSIPGVQKRSSNSSDKLHGPNLQSQFFKDALRSSNEIGQACEAVTGGPNDAGPHMTTLVVAKDMVSILDAYAGSDEAEGVEDASILNYWGFSYGTFIGQTFATLYPDRVGRVVLDGVVDGDDYSSGAVITNVIGADEALSTFFIYCHLAGPTQCPYYTGNTPHDIFLRFEETLLRLDTRAAFENNWPNATEISLGLEAIKVLGRVHAYFPIDNFPEFAELAVAFEAMSQNITMDKIQQVCTVQFIIWKHSLHHMKNLWSKSFTDTLVFQVASLPGGNFNLNNPGSAEWGRGKQIIQFPIVAG
jgi:pimeloyl-ACP methyl ester carboxylesterase